MFQGAVRQRTLETLLRVPTSFVPSLPNLPSRGQLLTCLLSLRIPLSFSSLNRPPPCTFLRPLTPHEQK